MPRRARRPLARALVLLLLTAGALLVVGGAPATARPGCTTEVPNILLVHCDDSTPPVTGMATGSVTGTTGSVTASASYTDADTGAIAFECSKDGGAWGPCTFPGLAAGQYAISIRAVDSNDAALRGCDDLLCLSPEVPDHDATPEQVTLTVNPGGGGTGTQSSGGTTKSSDPDTQITRGPVDRITPGSPVALTRRPEVVIAADEPATFRCALNARKVPCHEGRNVLKGLRPGPQVFVAQAVDRQGNFDRSPASLRFYVPVNVHAATGWHRVQRRGAYAGDYVTTARAGAVLNAGSVRGVREVRVVAPTGRRMGTLAVRVGGSRWMKLSLRSGRAEALHVFVLRRPGSRPLSGDLQVKALSVPPGGAVAVDALVAR